MGIIRGFRMADQTRGRDRRSFWSVFTVEEGFKRRQVARLLLLTALNVVVSTAAFVALQDSGDLGSWGGLQWEAPHLLRMAAGWLRPGARGGRWRLPG